MPLTNQITLEQTRQLIYTHLKSRYTRSINILILSSNFIHKKSLLVKEKLSLNQFIFLCVKENYQFNFPIHLTHFSLQNFFIPKMSNLKENKELDFIIVAYNKKVLVTDKFLNSIFFSEKIDENLQSLIGKNTIILTKNVVRFEKLVGIKHSKCIDINELDTSLLTNKYIKYNLNENVCKDEIENFSNTKFKYEKKLKSFYDYSSNEQLFLQCKKYLKILKCKLSQYINLTYNENFPFPIIETTIDKLYQNKNINLINLNEAEYLKYGAGLGKHRDNVFLYLFKKNNQLRMIIKK